MQHPVVPADKRNQTAFILAKQLSYFYRNAYAWPGLDYAAVPPSITSLKDFQFKGSFVNDTKWEAEKSTDVEIRELPHGVINLSHKNLEQKDFIDALGHSKVLIGIGKPSLSPSPYDALCMGVPFLNPVREWDKKNPDDRKSWLTQHDGIKYEQEPYVYHVKQYDDRVERTAAFWEAVGRAANTPIERYAFSFKL